MRAWIIRETDWTFFEEFWRVRNAPLPLHWLNSPSIHSPFALSWLHSKYFLQKRKISAKIKIFFLIKWFIYLGWIVFLNFITVCLLSDLFCEIHLAEDCSIMMSWIDAVWAVWYTNHLPCILDASVCSGGWEDHSEGATKGVTVTPASLKLNHLYCFNLPSLFIHSHRQAFFITSYTSFSIINSVHIMRCGQTVLLQISIIHRHGRM